MYKRKKEDKMNMRCTKCDDAKRLLLFLKIAIL